MLLFIIMVVSVILGALLSFLSLVSLGHCLVETSPLTMIIVVFSINQPEISHALHYPCRHWHGIVSVWLVSLYPRGDALLCTMGQGPHEQSSLGVARYKQ